MAKITTKQRKHLDDGVFGLPEQRKYPMPDAGHARVAKSYAAKEFDAGRLSAEDKSRIDEKADGILKMADGGMVSLRGSGMKSNMTKHFDKKATLRLTQPHYADGGIVKKITDTAQNAFADTFNAPTLAAFDASQTTDLRGSPGPLVGPQMPTQDRVPVSGAFAPNPNPVKPALQANNIGGIRAADGGDVDDLVARQGLRGAIRHGEVHGPGGPRDDKVPAMLSNGEFVIPADVVDKVGEGNLKSMIDKYHAPHANDASLRAQNHFAGGEKVGGQGPIDFNSINYEPTTPQAAVEPTMTGGSRAAPVEFNNAPGTASPASEPPVGARAAQMQDVLAENEARRSAWRTNNPGVTPERMARAQSFGTATPPPAAAAAEVAAPAAAEAAAPAAETAGNFLTRSRSAAGAAADVAKGAYGAGRSLAGATLRAASGLPALAAIPYLIGRGDYEIKDDTPSLPDAMFKRAGQLFTGTALPSDREEGRESVRKAGLEVGLDTASGAAKMVDYGAGLVGAHPDLSGRLRRQAQGDLGEFLDKPGGSRGGDTFKSPGSVSSDEGGMLEGGVAPRVPLKSSSDMDLMGPTADGNRHIQIGFDGPVGGADHQRAVKAYEDSIAAGGPGWRGGEDSLRGRYLEARSRALDPRYQRAQAENDARIDGASAKTDAEMASLRAQTLAGMQGNGGGGGGGDFYKPYGNAAPGSWDDFFNKRANARTMNARIGAEQQERDSLRSAGTLRRGQDIVARTAQGEQGVQNRGHELQYSASTYGHELSARTAANSARLAQMNADRKYNYDAYKDFGANGPGSGGGEQGRAEDAARQNAQAAHTKQLEAMYTDPATGKPDMARVSEHKQATTEGLGAIIRTLGESSNPADRETAKRINERGMNDADHQKIRALIDLKHRAQETHNGLDPWGTKFKDSSNPYDYEVLHPEEVAKGGDVRLGPPIDPNNPNGPTKGGTIRANHLKYNEKGNFFGVNFGKIDTSTFDPAKANLRVNPHDNIRAHTTPEDQRNAAELHAAATRAVGGSAQPRNIAELEASLRAPLTRAQIRQMNGGREPRWGDPGHEEWHSAK